VYHGHYDPVYLAQDDFSLGVELFARVLAHFEVEICAYVAHLLFCGDMPFIHAGIADGRDVRFLFRHLEVCLETGVPGWNDD
jgi:hypothetical protein